MRYKRLIRYLHTKNNMLLGQRARLLLYCIDFATYCKNKMYRQIYTWKNQYMVLYDHTMMILYWCCEL